MAMEVVYQVDIISDEYWDLAGWESKGAGACFKTREGAVAWTQEYIDELVGQYNFDPITLEEFAEIVECPLYDTV